jgi:serine/threonine-protein kinase RsbW
MSFDLDLVARPSEVVRAVEALRVLCHTAGLPEERAHDVCLALDEVLANVIRHGYKGDPRGAIHVLADLRDSELVLEVRDQARAFDPLSAPAPDLDRPVHERPIGGLGIHLVRSLVDHLEYAREQGENRLTLAWQLRRPPPES